METISLNVPETEQPRIVIVGAGFGGFTLAIKLKKSNYQVVLLDRNNFHQFQPLYYQVAMAGLEPSSISFPLRKSFQKSKNVLIRIAELQSVDTLAQIIETDQGSLSYDYLVVATGAVTNFFGNQEFEQNCFTLKTVSDALFLRNSILSDFEKAIQSSDYDSRQKYIDIVIVGGGPTGVELAGSLAEMKRYILPKDYHEIDYQEMDIYLIQSSDQLLPGMDKKLADKAFRYLDKMGVQVLLGERVTNVKDDIVITNLGKEITAGKVIWAAGVTCKQINGLNKEELIGYGNRLQVDQFNRVIGEENVFAIGDAALMKTEEYPNGHPQVAQPAIQQAKLLAKNVRKSQFAENWKTFSYKDYGQLATIGRNKAVAEFPRWNMKGFPAWLIWLLVHLYALVGVKNRLLVLFNWFWNYITYDQSLRVIIKPYNQKRQRSDEI